MTGIPQTMHAVWLTGHGGFEKLEYRTDVPVPVPEPGEVLIRVGAAGINNTDINTRIGWYSKSVSDGTTDGAEDGFADVETDDASWAGEALGFPRIQGIDACGRIVSVGEGVDPARIGERVLVEPCLRHYPGAQEGVYRFFGSECDGAFAQYTKVATEHAYRIDSSLEDAELASFPCAYSTAENMLTRADVKDGETVLVTGASGGVGSAAVQLAKRRGARVVAITSASKAFDVQDLGAASVIPRGSDPLQALGAESVDVVVDLVAGPDWPVLLELLKRGGRYAVSGAVAGPIVPLDVRTLYLKDLSFFGCTVLEPEVFANLIGIIERGEIRPTVAGAYGLEDIVKAQQDFLAKKFTGKLVLIPPE
jgi:NADPH:quinone reductase-like Zn-dependent oxidoreductase